MSEKNRLPKLANTDRFAEKEMDGQMDGQMFSEVLVDIL